MANEDKLLEMMSSMAQSIEGLKNGLTDLRIEMKQGFREVEERFKQVDARFDAVDRKFEEVDARFAKVDESFDRVDERFDKVEEEIRNINSRELHIMELVNKGRRTA